MSGIPKRYSTALVVLPVVLALIWVPALSWGLALFVAAIAAVGFHEYAAMLQKKSIHPLATPGLIAVAVMVLTAHTGQLALINLALVAAITLVAFLHVLQPPSAANLTGSAFGLVYTGWFPAHIILLHVQPRTGAGLVMALLVAVALTDTAAYFVGKNLGKHKLAPIVSPKKTWEGAFGGFAGAIIGMLIIYSLKNKYDWTALPDWSALRYAITGAAVSIVAQVGDLVASCFKRDAGIKDSGTLFPGHGGALDRCDGFLFAAPVLYYMAIY